MISNIFNNYILPFIDVFVVAYIFYRLILLIKGTRALQVLFGIIILFLLTIVSKQIIQLDTLNWILEKFWFTAAIIIAIVFQPELRTALAQLGKEPFPRLFLVQQLEIIPEIIYAIKEFKEKKIGALIVLEQNVGLKNFIETGVLINGNVSKELIQNIFNPGSVLHDGAMIIQGSKIISAGCILPLSENQEISKFLGTRHRAGVGITEISDTVVIVISEENGAISLIKEANIDYDIEPQELQKKLVELYKSRAARQKVISGNIIEKNYKVWNLLNNWELRLFSLILSFILWYYIKFGARP